MAKQPNIGNLAAGFRSSNRLNDNFDEIKEAFDNTISRDGSGPNQMNAALDMNSNPIINIPDPVNPGDIVRLQDIYLNNLETVSDLVDEAEGARDEAVAATVNKVDKAASAELLVRIPTDYPTAQAAIDDLSKKYGGNGFRINLMTETGHKWTRGIFVRDGNYSRFYLTYQGDLGVPGASSVQLAPGFIGVSDVSLKPTSNNRANNIIMGYNAVMPTLGCVIDAQHTGDSGYYGVWGCNGMVLPFCGVINAGFNGFEARGGFWQIYETKWNGANTSGIRAAYTANICAQSATADGCGQLPETPNAGAVDISRTSTIHFRSGSAQNSGANGANVRRGGRIVGEFANFSGAVYNGIEIGDSTIADLYGMVASNCGSGASGGGAGFGLVITSGSNATVFGATIKGNHGDGVTGRDVQMGEALNAAAYLDFSGCETTDGVDVLTNIRVSGGSNTISSWNTVTQAGIVFNKYKSAPGASWGEYSGTGVTSGKMMSANAFQSSRNSALLQSHMTFANPNGTVGSFSTVGTRMLFNYGPTTACITGGAGTPEGVVSAVVGSLWLRTDGGANTTLYIKESGSGTTGWVAK